MFLIRASGLTGKSFMGSDVEGQRLESPKRRRIHGSVSSTGSGRG